MVSSQLTARVRNLHNKYIVKQGREVPGKLRRNLSDGERRALDNLQSNWQSGGVSQSIRTEELRFALGQKGVSGIVGGEVRGSGGFEGIVERTRANERLLRTERSEPSFEEVVERVKAKERTSRIEKSKERKQEPRGSFIERTKDFVSDKKERIREAEARAEERQFERREGVEFSIPSLIGKSITKPTKFLEKKIEPLIPEGRTKDFLTKPRISISPHDIGTFVLFDPVLATTPQAFARAVSTKGLIPETETGFSAVVKTKGKLSDVEVISKTKIADDEFLTLSKQIAKDIKDDVTLSKGIGVTIPKGKGTAEIFDILGTSKDIGKGNLVKELRKDIGTLKIKGDFGTGSEGLTATIPRFKLKEGIDLFTGKPVIKVIRTPLLELRGLKLRGVFDKQRLTGVLKPMTDDTSFFLGQTRKPITRIDISGISKRLTDLDLAGVVKFIKKGTDNSDSIINKGLILKQQKQFQKSINAQVSAGIKTSVDIATKPIKRVSKVGRIKPVTSIFAEPKLSQSIIPGAVPGVTTQSDFGFKKGATTPSGSWITQDFIISDSKNRLFAEPNLRTGLTPTSNQRERMLLDIGLKKSTKTKTEQR